MSNQDNNLMDVYIDRLFKKHKIEQEEIDLSEDEKDRMRGIVQNIQTEVEKFLEKADKKVTENDMPANVNDSQVQPQQQIQQEGNNLQQDTAPMTKPKVYVRKNRRRK